MLPVCPVAPVLPVLPVVPLSPVMPLFPVCPVVPLSPVMPLSPVCPVAPVLPVAPRLPVSPVAPVCPVGPVCPTTIPVAPVCPVAPVLPVTPVCPVFPVFPVTPVCPVAPICPVAPVMAVIWGGCSISRISRAVCAVSVPLITAGFWVSLMGRCAVRIIRNRVFVVVAAIWKMRSLSVMVRVSSPSGVCAVMVTSTAWCRCWRMLWMRCGVPMSRTICWGMGYHSSGGFGVVMFIGLSEPGLAGFSFCLNQDFKSTV